MTVNPHKIFISACLLGRPVRSDVAPQGLCSLDDCNVGNYDFDYAAANRDSIKEKFNDLIAG